ncbi:MAG TPA: S24 family peptidase [Selenomonadales bacterium]|nr:S24 family peptidase [Selenomonadales bacterium]
MNNLLALRKKHNKKAIDLAKAMGISRNHYYELERGSRRLNADHIKSLIQIYNVTADEILGGYPEEDLDLRYVFSSQPEILNILQTHDIELLKYIKNRYNHNSLVKAIVLQFKITEKDAWNIIHSIDKFGDLSIDEQSRVANCIQTAAFIVDASLAKIIKDIPPEKSRDSTGLSFTQYIDQQLNELLHSENPASPYVPINATYIEGFINIPVIGRIPAGSPLIAAEYIEAYEDIPRSWLNGDPENYFILKVEGDSMEGAKIFDGDFALIKKSPTCDNGQICAVGITGETPDLYATLKRVYELDEEYLELVPENSKYPRRKVKRSEVNIFGVLRMVHRKY